MVARQCPGAMQVIVLSYKKLFATFRGSVPWLLAKSLKDSLVLRIYYRGRGHPSSWIATALDVQCLNRVGLRSTSKVV